MNEPWNEIFFAHLTNASLIKAARSNYKPKPLLYPHIYFPFWLGYSCHKSHLKGWARHEPDTLCFMNNNELGIYR